MERDGTVRRKVFDILLSAAGMFFAIGLIVAGSLLLWGHSFAESNVHNQLAEQQIYFPDKGSPELADPRIGPYLNQYGGQLLTTGPQAEAYADHYLAVRLSDMPYGGVYSRISSAARAGLTDKQLAGLALTSFQGSTMRGLLLEAYAISMFGQIALWGAILAFVLAALTAVLSVMGFLHNRRVRGTAALLDSRQETTTSV
jgi:hypothetical protein